MNSEKLFDIEPKKFEFFLSIPLEDGIKFSSLMLDFAYIDNYKSSLSNKKSSISHLFAQFDADLALENFTNSNFFLSIQKVTNDTYLKIFDGNLFKNKLR